MRRHSPISFGRSPLQSRLNKLQRLVLRTSTTPNTRNHPLFQGSKTITSLNTAFQALYGSRELGLTQRFDSTGTDETWVFIYGGSSGVGQFAIQLAKLSGYKVVTVASPRNHEFLKALGADAVFDVRTLTLRCFNPGG